MSRLPSSSLDAARKWPMLVMHEPMNTSSILAPATSDSVFTSSGSFGQATIGSWMSARSISITAAYSASASPLSSCGSFSQASCAAMRRCQRARVGVALGDHPLHQRDVAVDVLDDRLLVQVHRAAGGRALGGGIGQLEGLFHLQVGQAFDLEDAAGEDVLLALLLDRQQALLDGVQRNRVDQVAQGDAGLHLALEAHQHASRACPAASRRWRPRRRPGRSRPGS